MLRQWYVVMNDIIGICRIPLVSTPRPPSISQDSPSPDKNELSTPTYILNTAVRSSYFLRLSHSESQAMRTVYVEYGLRRDVD